MNPDYWPFVTTGIVILIAIATSNRSLRREMNVYIGDVRRELGERMDGLSERMDAIGEGLVDVRERLARVEGLLEGVGWKRHEPRGGKSGDEKPSPAPPRS